MLQLKTFKNGVRAYLNGVPLSRKPVRLERAVQQRNAILKGGSADEIKSYSLSEDDIKQIIPTLKVMSYPQLLEHDNIDDVLDEKGRLMLLYLTEDESTGHWVCLLKRGNKIEYFDPYGNYKPDEEKEWLTEDKLEQFGQDTDHLTKMLGSSGYKVVYSKAPFQEDKQDINTCGRHCATRLYFKHLSLPQYTQMVIDSGMSPDDFVSAFTFNMMRK